ncbi:AbiH family protein [Klebsiella pneumoniae]|uniref:AbiH family protein n=1 Tax=Klebsiella pneumoniae TaxID=573 RepID=UPI003F7AC4AC
MMSLWDALRMNMMISYQELVRTFHSFRVEKSLNPYIGPDQDIRIAEAYDSIDKYFGNTFKPSEDIIKEENVFFSSLKNVDEVIVLGKVRISRSFLPKLTR